MKTTKNKFMCITSLLAVIGIAWTVVGYPSAELVVPESDIIFSHQFHVEEQEIGCVDCHITIESSGLSSDKNLPTMDECGNCHDVEDDESCSVCHKNADEPMELINPSRPILFSHETHIAKGTACEKCHAGVSVAETLTVENMPRMTVCFECHDGVEVDDACALCHGTQLTLQDIHPVDWRHQHGDRASVDRVWCQNCHRQESFCIDCHRGDNLTGSIHNLNYQYTHGLEAKSNLIDCRRCHETRTFCVDCHNENNRMPLGHSKVSFLTEHGAAAIRDVENCASCHDVADPTCARAGCHIDLDGVRGTNPAIHSSSPALFDGHGAWHDDDGDYCYQCHTNTRQPGAGFCGYCHH